MAVNKAQQAEIQRKAKAGIALTNPTQASTALYNQYKSAKPAAAPATNVAPKVSTGTPATAQAWINDPRSGFGGMDKYTVMQQSKYDNAVVNRDYDMMTNLYKDTARVGYSLKSPAKSNAVESAPGTVPNPANTGFTAPNTPVLSWDQALGQAGSQLDPLLQRALSGVDANRYQDQLNAGDVAAAYGGNHSGLAADAQNKVQIAASGKKADLQAQRDTTAAQMADALVSRSQDRADQLRQQAFAEWMGQQNVGLSRDQFDWGKTIDTSNQTGYWNGQRNMAGQAHDLNSTQIMAALTGRLPNGQKTSAQQQMELENLWKSADATGVIPDSLATMYGMPKGTQTLAAKQFAMNNSLDWFNANTSRSSSNSSSSNAAFGRLTDIWAATGKAPSGLESYGVNAGDPYKPEVAAQLQPPTAESMRTYFDGMVHRDKDGRLTNAADIEASILNSPVSDYDAYQLYLRYGLSWTGPVPSPN